MNNRKLVAIIVIFLSFFVFSANFAYAESPVCGSATACFWKNTADITTSNSGLSPFPDKKMCSPGIGFNLKTINDGLTITGFTWNCIYGSIISCSAGYAPTSSCGSTPTLINGVCGSDNGQTLSSAPTNLCNAGTASALSGNGPWYWSCAGSNGGATAYCSAQKTVTPITGQCGSSQGQTFNSTPTSNLCNLGTASTVSHKGGTYQAWIWNCNSTACYANAPAPNGSFSVSYDSNSKSATILVNVTETSVRPTKFEVRFGETPSLGVTDIKKWVDVPTVGSYSVIMPNLQSGKTYYAFISIVAVGVSKDLGTKSFQTENIPAPINGTCGSDNGQTLSTTPTNLCSSGTSASFTGSGPWYWICVGSNGGTTASCSANKTTAPTVGACGSSNGAVIASFINNSAGLCSVGTSSLSTIVNEGNGKTHFTWTCSASGGTASCSSVSACGSSAGQTFSSVPTVNLCSIGTAVNISTSNKYMWDCITAYGYPAISCTANIQTVNPVNGACGSDNGQTLSSAPTNLCNAGTASALSGSGPWYWSCAGSNGGATAYCSAQKATSTFACGSSAGQTFSSVPTSNLCSFGTASRVSVHENETARLFCTNPTGQQLPGNSYDRWYWTCGTLNCSADNPNDNIRAMFSSTEMVSYTGSASSPDRVEFWAEATCPNSGSQFDYNVPLNYNLTSCTSSAPLGSHGGCSCCIMTKLVLTKKVANVVNGACGSDNGQTLSFTPTNLCNTGTASALSGSGPWYWSCAGSNGGTTAYCSAQKTSVIVNGACGSDNGQTLSTTPTNLCSSGTSFGVSGSGPWYWACYGSNGGTTAYCSAQKAAVIVNGACGPDNNQSLPSAPTNLCNTGIASSVSGSGPWYWACYGSNGGTTAYCSAQKAAVAINGVCGSDNGASLFSAPTNLCNAGTASSLSGSGPWYWSCVGSNGGATAYCSANLAQAQNPVVYAGAAKQVQSGQSISFNDATASDPNGFYPLTYAWSCTGGTLSNNNVLNPSYYAPNVSVDTIYTCNLIVTNTHSLSATSSVSITVLGNNTNNPPVVYAGAAKQVQSGQSISFNDATASDPNGFYPLTYAWSCTGGTLSSYSILNPTYFAPNVNSDTNYTCTLVVADSHSLSASSTVNVLVRSQNNNQPPTVYAGSNKQVQSGQSVYFSDATASDPNGRPLTYSWSCTGGSLSSYNILHPTYFAYTGVNTNYTCTLLVSNGYTSASSTVNVFVTTASNNQPPTVYAGSAKNIQSGQSIYMNATANDPNGLSLTYSWSCTGGTLSNYNTLNPNYIAPYVSSTSYYTCTLTAYNTQGLSATSSVSITVNGGYNYNQLPVVYAGPNKTIQSGQSVKFDSTAYDPNGSYLTYSWSCTGGTLSSYSMLSPTFYAPYVSSNTNYTCTIRAYNNSGGSSSSSVNILVTSGTSYNNPPTVNAGTNKDLQSGQSVYMNATAYDYNSSYLTYTWSCTGGSLSSYNTLNPNYTAPYVSSTNYYTCSLTARNTQGLSATSSVSITVRPGNVVINVSNLDVVTNKPTDIRTTSAILNGRLIGDSGDYATVSFNYGRDNRMSLTTPSTSYKRANDYFYNLISGLKKGKAYYYRAEASNTRGERVYGQTVAFITAPDAPSFFNASLAPDSGVNLYWTTGEGACYTVITRKLNSYPVTSTDGVVVYFGTGISYFDASAYNNRNYYYRAWSVGCDQGLYSWSDSVYAKKYINTYRESTTTTTTIIKEVEIPLRTLSLQVTGKNPIVCGVGVNTNNILSANPGDQIEITIKVSSADGKSLDNVMLTNVLPVKIDSVSDVAIDGKLYSGDINGTILLGKILANQTKTITFKVRIGSSDLFQENTTLSDNVEVNAKGVETVRGSVGINVAGQKVKSDSMAGISLFTGGWWILLWFIIGLIIGLIIFLLIYLINKKTQERRSINQANELERSKYFNIQQ